MKTIDVAQLQAMRANGEPMTLVNTLDAKDFAQTRIAGSVNVPQSADDFVDRVEQEAGGKNRTIVAYCASAACDSSDQGAKKLETAGFSQVLVFKGGAKAWKEQQEQAPAV